MRLPRVSFYFNVDTLNDCLFPCLIALFQAQQRVCLLCADEQQRQAIDRFLWLSPQHFLPHLPSESPWAKQTPIILDCVPQYTPADTCMNIARHQFASAIPYTRIIEFVTLQTEDRQAARLRYRHWQSLGCAIESHDITQISDWTTQR